MRLARVAHQPSPRAAASRCSVSTSELQCLQSPVCQIKQLVKKSQPVSTIQPDICCTISTVSLEIKIKIELDCDSSCSMAECCGATSVLASGSQSGYACTLKPLAIVDTRETTADFQTRLNKFNRYVECREFGVSAGHQAMSKLKLKSKCQRCRRCRCHCGGF